MTELREGELYVCLEQRLVQVREQVVDLTVKEFDILALLIRNPKRVFTYEMIIELVWNEDYSNYSRKAVNNHISNMRKKLKISPDVPDYIKSVSGVDINLIFNKAKLQVISISCGFVLFSSNYTNTIR